MPRLSSFTTAAPASRASVFLCAEMATCAELLGRLMPMASIAEAMVLAVYMPPQDPAPGMAHDSIFCSCLSLIVPAARWPTASKTETTSRFLPLRQPGRMVPP